MVSASFVLPHMSSDFVPVEVLLLGGVMLVIIVILQGAGRSRIVDRYQRNAAMLRRRNWHPHTTMTIFRGRHSTHADITQACIWGVVLNKVGLMPNLRDSMYFSTDTDTNIG